MSLSPGDVKFKMDVEISDGKDAGLDSVQKDQAREYNAAQHNETWKQAIRSNPKSLLWCCYALFTCIMWGYDGLAGSIVLAISNFRQDYGNEFNGQFVVPAIWQLAFGGGGLIGLLVGGIGAGLLAKRWGRQLCFFISYLFTIAGVFLQWFSSPGDLPMFFGGKILTGIPLGVFVTIAPTYCAEIAPFALRGAVTAAVNWSIVFGQCLAYVVMRQTQYLVGANSYRILFAVQWGFAGIALVVLPFFPESPYHLVAQGRVDKAKINTRRLHDARFDVEGFICSIKEDLETQVRTQRGASYRECFRGKNSQRTLIAMSTFFVQSVCGITWIIGYVSQSPYRDLAS
jgi:MFS family permease